MHERALLKDVVTRVEELARAEGASRVTRVTVRLGALSHLTPSHFREHFEDTARGSLAEGASVDAEVDDDIGSPRASEVVLESVEVEV